MNGLRSHPDNQKFKFLKAQQSWPNTKWVNSLCGIILEAMKMLTNTPSDPSIWLLNAWNSNRNASLLFEDLALLDSHSFQDAVVNVGCIIQAALGCLHCL